MSPSSTRGLGLNIVAESEESIEPAYAKYYSALAEHFVLEIRSLGRVRRVLEVGAGKGQLTVPLLKKLPRNVRLIAADSSKGPYVGWLDELSRILASKGLDEKVQVLRDDARRLAGVGNESVELIVSNELLCDLTREVELRSAFTEFNRVLKPGGMMVHGEWSSFPENRSQSFLVKHRPSWGPDQLFSLTRKSGFHDFRVTYFDTTISFGYRAAVKELRVWGAEESLIRKCDELIRRYGMRLPYEHVISCRKVEKSRP